MRVYKNEKYGITLYNGDCLDVMGRLITLDVKVDAIITDPPYGMNYKSSRRKDETKFDKIVGDTNVNDLVCSSLTLMDKMLKINSAIYCFCSWHFVDVFKLAFEKHFTLKNIIVWLKNNHGAGDLEGAYAPKHEFILFGHKGRSLHRLKRVPDVLRVSKVNGCEMVHPTEKPVRLIKQFVENNTDKGNMVLDSFMGSGTTGVACINTGRRFIGIELDEGYFDISVKRIEEAIRIKEAQPMSVFEKAKKKEERSEQKKLF